MYELKNKIKSSAYLIASIIQQVKNTSNEKTLTKDDLKRIFWASGFNFFHNHSAFYPYPFGIYFLLRLYYVKKKSNSEYDYQLIRFSTGGDKTFTDPVQKIGHALFKVETKTQNEIENIHPDLVCNNINDERLLIECWYGSAGFNKSKLGFIIITPHIGGAAPTTDIGVFSYQLVIVPKPGLFPIIN